jgi:hypothetical protein
MKAGDNASKPLTGLLSSQKWDLSALPDMLPLTAIQQSSIHPGAIDHNITTTIWYEVGLTVHTPYHLVGRRVTLFFIV